MHVRAVCWMLVVAGCCIAPVAQARAQEWQDLFDGESLTGWDGNPKFWSVEEGAITGRTTAENPTQGNTFLIWRGGDVENFVLRLKFKLVGGNSGIQYRSREMGEWVLGGYQGDFEAGERYSGILYEERGRGILAERGQVVVVGADGEKMVIGSVGESADIQKAIKQEDWNDYMIIADGFRITHLINGRVTAILYDLQEDRRTASGLLGLQLHAGPPMTVQFKDIQLMPIVGLD